MPISPRLKSFAVNLALLVGVTTVTLVVLDLALMATGILPPTYNPGDPRVGWMSALPSGQMVKAGCLDLASGRRIDVSRNEDGVRSDRPKAELVGPGPRYEVVVSGDSHTDLCAENANTHFGFTARFLSDSGAPTDAYAFGSGKYSPLQAYLAIAPTIEAYQPDALILNLYTGNDFYDMLRVDDRPYFEEQDGGYVIAPPVWYTYDPPGEPPKSRVLFAGRRLAEVVGIHRVVLRVGYLRDVASRQQQGIGVVWGYMNDLRRSADDQIGYPQAYTAQMLNQQLFFHHFPGSREESVRRVRALLQLVKQKHPDLLLVLSPIPSYQLVVPTPTDSGMMRVLDRLPITYAGGVAEEEALYSGLRTIAEESGWSFVDNLPSLRAYPTPDSLFNHFDYHIEPNASEIIGRNQAALIAARRNAARTLSVRGQQ